MPKATPPYYTTLSPFRDLFARGQPMLMYHKLGPRPHGVRLKGLYIGESLFARQMRELRDAGYRSAMPGEAMSGRDSIVITFDDGYVNVLEHGLPVLLENNFRTVQYIVAGEIGEHNRWDVAQGEVAAPLMNRAQLGEWLAAGQVIGSHSMTHAWLTRISAEQAREEIVSSKKRLEDLFGVAVEHFCYPYGDWNPAVRDLVQAAGYRTACTTACGVNTADTDPYAFSRLLVRYQSRSPRALWRRVRG